jgi:FlaA1/EpsC-like NDP-sugar epimerase
MSTIDTSSVSVKTISTILAIGFGIGIFTFRRYNQKKNLIRFMQPNLSFSIISPTVKTSGKRAVLVTGGEGFIGKYIVNLLLKVGCKVVVFDIVLPSENTRNPEVRLLIP